MTVMLMKCVFFGLFYAFWRRCYGGLDSNLWKRWFPENGSAIHRWFWRIVDLVSVFLVMHLHREVGWLWSSYVAIVIQFVFWDWTFGMYMGMGRHDFPLSQDEIDEYEDQFFAPFLNLLVGKEGRYGELYDYLGMLFRFSAPCLLLFFVPTMNMGMGILGILIATFYLMETRFGELGYRGFLFGNFAELASGFSVGMALMCM